MKLRKWIKLCYTRNVGISGNNKWLRKECFKIFWMNKKKWWIRSMRNTVWWKWKPRMSLINGRGRIGWKIGKSCWNRSKIGIYRNWPGSKRLKLKRRSWINGSKWWFRKRIRPLKGSAKSRLKIKTRWCRKIKSPTWLNCSGNRRVWTKIRLLWNIKDRKLNVRSFLLNKKNKRGKKKRPKLRDFEKCKKKLLTKKSIWIKSEPKKKWRQMTANWKNKKKKRRENMQSK